MYIFQRKTQKEQVREGGSPKKIETANSLGHKEYVCQVSLTYDDGKGKKKIGGTLSGEAAGAAAEEAERALDAKFASFKVPPFLNQMEFRRAVFGRVLRQGPKKTIETI